MIWAKEETLSREEIKEIQTARLRETVERVYHTVEPYRKKMDEAGLKPEDIRGLEDLHNLPFTTKQDMRDKSIQSCLHGSLFILFEGISCHGYDRNG